MNYKVDYKAKNKMADLPLSSLSLDNEIGSRFDRFVYERTSSGFAIREILREAERGYADKFDDEHGAGMWRSEFWGKLVISAARVARMKNDESLKAELAESVKRVLAYQQEDGYLSTYLNRKNIFGSNTDDPTWSLAGWDSNWNIWGQKYTLWALLECYMLLEDEGILKAAARLADNVIATLNECGVSLTDTGVLTGLPAGSMMKPMLILYRFTGDKKYLDICLEAAADWDREDGKWPNLIANSLKGIPVHKWYEESDGWIAKAYEMMSCFDGICELYRITGNARLLEATECFWELVKKYESNILGSVGYCERFSNAAAYPDSATEVCDAIHWMRLSYELFIITGKARYADAFERAFLNAFLAGVYNDGKWGAFFVRSSGKHWDAQPQCDTKYQHCCVNNAARGFVNAAQMAVTECDGAYYISSYIPATVRLGEVTFRISSGYTDRGSAAIFVRGLKPGTKVYLRAPEWSNKSTASLMRKGEKVELEQGEYTAISLDSDNTVIEVKFDMTPRVIPFGGEFKSIPDNDYHVQRWQDSRGGPCTKDSMVKAPMCTVQRGPIILARSKKICSKEEDMFSTDTVFGKDVKCTAAAMRHEPMLSMCYVTLDDGVEKRTYTMCDYASATNCATPDPYYFTVFV